MTHEEKYEVLDALASDMSEENLWNAIVAFQNESFHTVSGLPYIYELKVGRSGNYNKEIIVNRREGSKSIVWSSVLLAFNNALKLKGTVIQKPKALGDIRGISYIYPILYRFKVIEIPDSYRSIID